MTGNNPYTISWSTPGRKYILLKAQNGPCFVHDTATVYVIAQADAHFNLPDNGCINAATILHPGYSEFSSYHWTIDEQSITDTVFVDPYFFNWTSTGKKIFSLRVNSLRGCGTDEFTDSIIIHERTTPPILGLGQDYYCLGEPLTVSTKEESGATYSWTPIDDFSGNNAPSINYHGKGGKIRLRLIDAWGCSAEDSADINVKDCCNLVLPGAFTPDNDGRNDKFGVINPEEYTLETFIVKNRWGNTVFETRDVNTGWDGTYKGQPQDGGTYFYFIKYNCPMKKTTISKGGDVVLVR
jgi:gliding motility-associated-like protein